MIVLRVYLLIGLVAHKLLWEVLKRRSRLAGAGSPRARSLRERAVKAVKLLILSGLVVQVFLPDVFPIAGDALLIRVIGVAVYSVGWLVAILGRVQLGDNWSDIESATVLEEQSVVRRGLYRYIRHPIYIGDLLLLLGLQLSLNSWLALGVAVLAPVVLRQAIREEAILAESLPGYVDYCRSTKRFIPFVI